MVIAWHDAAFTLPDAVLTPDIMNQVLGKFHLQHKLKSTWTRDESKLLEKLIFQNEEEMTGTSTENYVKDEKMVEDQNKLYEEIS